MGIGTSVTGRIVSVGLGFNVLVIVGEGVTDNVGVNVIVNITVCDRVGVGVCCCVAVVESLVSEGEIVVNKGVSKNKVATAVFKTLVIVATGVLSFITRVATRSGISSIL